MAELRTSVGRCASRKQGGSETTMQAQRESEDHFRLLYEQAPLAYQSLDADATILDVNAAWCELFGRPREEVLGRFIGDFLSEASGALLDGYFSRFKREGRTDGNLFEIVRGDGKTRLVEVSGRVARDAEGNFLRTNCILTDVTQRRQAESQLRLAATVFDQANEAITITDDKANIVAVSPRFTAITGYPADEVIGKNPRILQSGRHDAVFYMKMWSELTSLGRWSGEIWNKRRDGTIYPEWLSISVVRDESGKISNYVGVFSDLTEHRQNEHALRESEERLATLIESIPDAIFFKDNEGRWQVINGAAKELFAIGDERWRGKNDLELAVMRPEMSEQHMACHDSDEQAWSRGCLTHSTEVVPQGDGGDRFFDVSKVPLFDAAGNRHALVVIGRDVTVQRRHEEALEHHNEDLERRIEERTQALQAANRELESFSYSVSHDLRTPLRAVNGFSHLLDQQYADSLDDRARDYLARLCAAAKRMDELIDNLLKLAQMSRQTMHMAPTNLSEIAAEVAADLQAGESQRKAEWVIAPDIVATGDPGLLRVVLQNLLGNAWKYSSRREQARIEFGVCEKTERGNPSSGSRKAEKCFFVRDNGAGFDMAYASKLFGAFQRLHAVSEFPGSGIGLATVARIIHRHGGEVWAEGKVGEGATFFFTLVS